MPGCFKIFKLFLFILLSLNVFSQSNESFYKGQVAFMSNDIDSAIIHYSAEIQNSKMQAAYFNRAICYYNNANYNKAIEDLNSLQGYKDSEVTLWLSRCYYLSNRVSDAIKSLKDHLKTENHLLKHHIVTDSILKSLRETKEWDDLWLEDWYSESENQLNEIYYFRTIGKLEDAINLADEFILKYPKSDKGYYVRAILFSELNDWQNSVSDYSKAISNNSSVYNYYFEKATLLNNNKRYKKASIDYYNAYKLDTLNVSLLKLRAITAFKGRNFKTALSDFKKYALYINNDPETYDYCAQIMAADQNWEEAISFYDKAIYYDSSIYEYYLKRGIAKLELKSYKEADKDFGMALDLSPRNQEANHFKGVTLLMTGDEKSACSYFKKAIELGYPESQIYYSRNCLK